MVRNRRETPASSCIDTFPATDARLRRHRNTPVIHRCATFFQRSWPLYGSRRPTTSPLAVWNDADGARLRSPAAVHRPRILPCQLIQQHRSFQSINSAPAPGGSPADTAGRAAPRFRVQLFDARCSAAVSPSPSPPVSVAGAPSTGSVLVAKTPQQCNKLSPLVVYSSSDFRTMMDFVKDDFGKIEYFSSSVISSGLSLQIPAVHTPISAR